MFALLDGVEQGADVVGVPSERPGRHLPMQHQGGDIRVIGRDLAPALRAILLGDAHEAHERVAERFDALDLHRGSLRA